MLNRKLGENSLQILAPAPDIEALEIRPVLADVFDAARFLAARDDALPLALLIAIDMNDLRLRESGSQPGEAERHAIEFEQHFIAPLRGLFDQIREIRIEIAGAVFRSQMKIASCPIRVE